MEGNDIGGYYTKRQVVVLEPLLFAPPSGKTVTSLLMGKGWGKTKRMLDHFADQWELNKLMCQWINDMGYRYSMPTEVWSFLPIELFDRLQPIVDRISGNYIVEWNCWGHVGEAYTALRANPDLVVVYDADVDRVERYWHFRGTRVLQGGIPT